MLFRAHPVRQRVVERAREVADGPVDAGAQLPVGQAGGQGVDGYEAAGVQGWAIAGFVFGVIEGQLTAVLDESATEGDRLADLDAQAGETMAQPHRVDGAGVVAD